MRIEFEAKAEDVLLSDFELWHFVLNSWYLPGSMHEQDARSVEEIESSWNHIFDLDFAPRDIAVPRAEKRIQAVLWEIELGSVRSVQSFVSRGRGGIACRDGH